MKRCFQLLIAASVALATQALAQGYPAKPVQVIIGFTPGSAADIVGRTVAAKLSEIWGQPVVAENRVGAGGSIAAALVAKAAPDGYTLLVHSSAHVANAALYANLPYDTRKDFTNLALLAAGPTVLIVAPQTGWKTLGDFVAAAKGAPGKLNFSSGGVGSGTHFSLEKLRMMAGIDVIHVPYKGSPEALNDTIAGRVCCYFSPINAALAHLRSGRAVALAVSSAERSTLLPEVPTIGESGVSGFDYTLWVGMWGPAGMPPQLAEAINRDVNRALERPDLRKQLANLGNEPRNMSLAEFDRFVRQEIAESARLVKAAGITPQ
jgi:tripartite-type tricarboxylate transporter receptor subunit TctC